MPESTYRVQQPATLPLSQQLLVLLADGQFHSGEELGQTLTISRTAIWKQLHNIQDKYQLQLHAVRGKGYRLSTPIELVDPQLLNQLVNNKNKSLINNIHSFIELESTNQWLLEQLRHDDIHGVVCHAEFQSAGRGRRQREWYSPLGCNLYFSIGWRFDSQLAALAGLSLTIGVAIASALQQLGLKNVGLKWPNDIYVNNKKLAGILIEVRGESNGPATAIIGIGINIDMPEHGSNKIDQAWTDLHRQGLQELSRNEILAACLNSLARHLEAFAQTSRLEQQQLWQQYDILLNQQIVIDDNNARYHAIARGIDTDGSLTIEVDGKIRHLHAGDVSLKLG